MVVLLKVDGRIPCGRARGSLSAMKVDGRMAEARARGSLSAMKVDGRIAEARARCERLSPLVVSRFTNKYKQSNNKQVCTIPIVPRLPAYYAMVAVVQKCDGNTTQWWLPRRLPMKVSRSLLGQQRCQMSNTTVLRQVHRKCVRRHRTMHVHPRRTSTNHRYTTWQNTLPSNF